MKKFTALVIALVVLCAIVPFAVSADEPQTFWLTHYNDNTAEGAGVVYTDADTAGAWSHHVAFKPIEGTSNAFEIVAIALGDGSATQLAVPEGGFVYAINAGNNWPDLFAKSGATGDGKTGEWYDDPTHAAMPDYTSAACGAMFTAVQGWGVGDKFVINGVDLVNLAVPTNTKTTDWYEDEYFCTATYVAYDGTNAVESTQSEETSEEPSSEEESVAESESATSTVSTVSEESVTESESSEQAETSASGEDEGGLSTGAIVGIIAAVVVVAAAIAALVAKKKKK